jgi:mitochondrial fission protein ELM1
MLNRGIKRKNPSVTCVQILNPYIASSNFDYVIFPRHDMNDANDVKGKFKAGSNVLPMTGSIHDKTLDVLAAAKESYRGTHLSSLPSPRVTLLLGASHPRHCSYNIQQLETSVRNVVSCVQNQGGSVSIMGSRRTPKETMLRVRQILKDVGCPNFVWSPNEELQLEQNGETENNPYVGVLAWSDGVFVTPDSITMTSEAISSDPTLGVYVMLSSSPSGKFQRFFEELWARDNHHCEEAVLSALPNLTSASPCVRQLLKTNTAAADKDLDKIVNTITQGIQ